MTVFAHKLNLALTVIALGISGILGISACSSTGDKPKPAELAPLVNTLAVKQIWTAPISAGTADFVTAVAGAELVVASKDGVVTRLDAATGKAISTYRHEQAISAAAGADAEVSAMVDTRNELVVIKRDGAASWRQKLPAQVLAAPLVSKGSVFVLSADQTIRAFDVASGSSLWTSTRAAPSLLLGRAGGMAIEGETLFVALAQGRVAAVSTSSGAVRWEQVAASARGANEVEKLTDLIGAPGLASGDLCVRSFQAGLACVAQQSGRGKWTKSILGNAPIAVDQKLVIASDRDGVISALNRETGEVLFTIDRLKYRDLSGPASLGRSFALGDGTGTVHWFNRESGASLARVTTDGTAINTAPILAGQTLLVRTQNALYAFVPE